MSIQDNINMLFRVASNYEANAIKLAQVPDHSTNEYNVRQELDKYKPSLDQDFNKILQSASDNIFNGGGELKYFKINVTFSAQVDNNKVASATVGFVPAPSLEKIIDKTSQSPAHSKMIAQTASARLGPTWSKKISQALSGKFNAGPLTINPIPGEGENSWFVIEWRLRDQQTGSE